MGIYGSYANRLIEIQNERATFLKGNVTLYHGSIYGNYQKILNNSPNNGKRWESIRQSSFWFMKKEYATMFATAELLQKESNKKIYILIDNDMRCLVPNKYKQEAENIIKNNKSYVYIKTVDGKYINGGQGRNFPEYTLDFEVTPDEIYTNTYNNMKKSIKFCTDEYLESIIQKYKNNTMTFGNSLIGQILDNIQYDTHQNIIKAKKTIKKYNESVDFESKLNKDDILNILKDFKYDKSQFCLVYKAALVLQGVVSECNDIDVCISKSLHNQLVKDGYKIEKAPLGGPKFTINDRLECFTEEDYNKGSVSCCGYKCKSIKHCLEEYKRRNREKDKATIEVIEKFMNNTKKKVSDFLFMIDTTPAAYS